MTYRMNPKSAAQAGEGTPLIRVLVVDDHPLVRAGIVAALSNLPDMVVVGQVGDGSQAIAAVAELAPDVVLMDLRMPILNGVEATVRIVKNGGQVPRVLVLTTIDTDAAIVHAVKAGAAGYLLKDIPAEELIDAVRAVAAGRYVLESAMAARVARVTQHAAERLTAREVEVLTLVATGKTSAAVGREMFISENTVKTHLARAYTKLGVSDRAGAVTEARRRGWIT